MVDHKVLRLGTGLLFSGALISIGADVLHPDGGNDHKAAFAAYAASGDWTAVHLGQFVGTAVILAGLLVLFFALNVSEGTPRWLGFFGAISAGVTLALTGVLYAVDGVALKQAVDAWASAAASEQATRFASADAIRWLEWGIRSYQDFLFGLSLVFVALVIVWTAQVSRPIGYLMGLSGLAYLVLGWLIGTEGFAPIGEVPSDAAQVLLLASIIWLLIVVWRRKASVQAAPAQAIPWQTPQQVP
jgi:hypothetical protein